MRRAAHDRHIQAIRTYDKYEKLTASRFKDKSLPPYAGTELCPDPAYRPSNRRNNNADS